MAAEFANGGNTIGGQAFAERLACPPQQADRVGDQEGLGVGAANDGEAARLVQIGGDLGQELVVTEADRDRNADIGFNAPGKVDAKFSFQVQHRYASELRWEFTMVSSTLMSVTSFIVSGRTVEAFERSAA